MFRRTYKRTKFWCFVFIVAHLPPLVPSRSVGRTFSGKRASSYVFVETSENVGHLPVVSLQLFLLGTRAAVTTSPQPCWPMPNYCDLFSTKESLPRCRRWGAIRRSSNSSSRRRTQNQPKTDRTRIKIFDYVSRSRSNDSLAPVHQHQSFIFIDFFTGILISHVLSILRWQPTHINIYIVIHWDGSSICVYYCCCCSFYLGCIL